MAPRSAAAGVCRSMCEVFVLLPSRRGATHDASDRCSLLVCA